MSIETNIHNYIKENTIHVFCIKDMLEFGDYKSVAKAVERLTIKGIIRRLSQGIYYFPLINKSFNQEYPPEIEDIASAISRNNNWEIRETGSVALYKLGIDNQIPQKYVYLSSGPYREYTIGNRIIEFKTSSQKNFTYSRKNSLIIQALKALGKNHISVMTISKFSSALTSEEKTSLLDEMKHAPIWMHPYIKEIGGK